MTNRVLSFAKDHSNIMRYETIESSIREDDLKQYLEQVIREKQFDNK